MQKLATVIMAAGKGTRMKSDLPKVLHPLNGRAMIHYVIDLADKLKSEKTILVIGHKKELVEEECADRDVRFAIQEKQLGTGHAVQMAEPELKEFDGAVLVLSGDVPLLTETTLQKLVKSHLDNAAVCTLLTARLDDPTGYGRVIRKNDGSVARIVEHKDASEDELKIDEINVGIYIFDSKNLFKALSNVDNDNAQGEYYLPDVIEIFINEGKKISAVVAESFDETRGINTVEQLRQAETILNSRR